MRGLLTVSTGGAAPRAGFDPDLRWRLHPQVAVRNEPFGALLYHFGTRKLSFLKNRAMVALVRALSDSPDARTACRAAGIAANEDDAYLAALGSLAESNMVVPAAAPPQERT